MNFLLDTHVLIWWSISPGNLSEQVRNLLDNVDNQLFLSLVSIWEMQIKLQTGKLMLNLPLPELIESQQQTNDLQILPIKLNHIYQIAGLPNHHRDPFDRLLIAQAIVENIPLISMDSVFDAYPVQKIW